MVLQLDGDPALPSELLGLLPHRYAELAHPSVFRAAVGCWIEAQVLSHPEVLEKMDYWDGSMVFDQENQEYQLWFDFGKLDFEQEAYVDLIRAYTDAHPRFGFRQEWPDLSECRTCIRAAASDLVLDDDFRKLFPCFVVALQDGYYPVWNPDEEEFRFRAAILSGPLKTLRYPRGRLESGKDGSLTFPFDLLHQLMWNPKGA